MKVVIIGGVAGGASCAARLRRLDESAEIVLLERGKYISYANCGLPYHIGGAIKERSALLLLSPEDMRSRFNIDVRVESEAVSINRQKKTVTVIKNGEKYEESYDKCVIATGSSPIIPPIEGIDSPRVKTLWTIPDTDAIIKDLRNAGVKSAAVIGGGFIGLETAENLARVGVKVELVEMLAQVMPPLDPEMAELIHMNIRENGIGLHLGDGLKSIADDGNKVTLTLLSGKLLEAELVILSVGVRPNGALAAKAELETNKRGGVVVDGAMRTSDPDIYAVGDVAEIEDAVFGGKTMVPLAGPANKQGRIAADNIAGGEAVYRRTQGSSVAKVFDLTVASTGANEKALLMRKLVKGKDYETLIITQNSHAGYYPGAVPMTLKLLFSADGKKIFGAQIVGRDGVDKRIDTIGVVMRMGGGIQDLKDLELAYAPPYSSAKDPVNMAGFVAENIIKGLVRFSDVILDSTRIILDVRESAELLAFEIPGAKHIPLGELRERLGELDKEKPIVTFCAIGVRSYAAARILMQKGFNDVSVYPGGTRLYQALNEKSEEIPMEPKTESAAPASPITTVKLDCNGMQCPGPILKVFETVKNMKDGETLEVVASDPGFVRDIESWCRRTGNTLISKGNKGDEFAAVVKKGTLPSPSPAKAADGKTIIVFSGDLDKLIASFIIANGAAAMGRPVTMFFTFWGLNALRKPKKQKVAKTFIESMFGKMLPRGIDKLKLSKMNMGGAGTLMMKKIMQKKNVDSLDALMKSALSNGVKLIACTMSMDVMGIKREELIDGVEFAGVGTYLGDAEESNVNLFI